MSQKFTLNLATMELTCPDGTVKKMVLTDDTTEHYAEWNDIGFFFYTRSGDYWWQGQLPTYPGNPYLKGFKLVLTTDN